MDYSIEEVKESQKIFYYLLEHGELMEEKASALYKTYVENERIMELVKSQGEIAECQIVRYGNIIYLIPNVENEYIGFAKKNLKSALCRSNGTDKDYYLSQFVILTLLVEFYEGKGTTSKVRDFMKAGELLNCVSVRLKEGAQKSEDEQEEKGIAFTNMLESFEALKSSEKGSRAKTTKEGFLHTILSFLQNQGLIEYVEADEMITTTKKLDQFMDYHLLNRNNYQRVLEALGVMKDE